MPYATTHILVAVILIELFRDFIIKDNKKFPRYYILFAALGGILPDFDVGAFYLLNFFGFAFSQVHRTIFHTIFIPLVLFAIGGIFLYFHLNSKKVSKHHLKLSWVFFILGFGTLLHLLLDMTFSGSIPLFYPISKLEIGLNLISYAPENLRNLILPTIDAILLVFWLFWMEFKLKVNNYF